MTEEQITHEVFEHLVNLAALALDPSQSEYLRSELNNQLNAIHELMAIPLNDSIPLASHGVVITKEKMPELRQDIWHACMNTEDIIAQAPVSEDGYIIVPEIPHEDME